MYDRNNDDTHGQLFTRRPLFWDSEDKNMTEVYDIDEKSSWLKFDEVNLPANYDDEHLGLSPYSVSVDSEQQSMNMSRLGEINEEHNYPVPIECEQDSWSLSKLVTNQYPQSVSCEQENLSVSGFETINERYKHLTSIDTKEKSKSLSELNVHTDRYSYLISVDKKEKSKSVSDIDTVHTEQSIFLPILGNEKTLSFSALSSNKIKVEYSSSPTLINFLESSRSDLSEYSPVSLTPKFFHNIPFHNEEQINKQYTEPSKLRNYIYEWMKKQDIYTVPIQWLLLELEIRKVCKSKQCSFITYKRTLKIGKEKSLGDDNFIKNGLRFHHLFGVLLYFEEVKGMCELVITNHRWLFEKLSEIVNFSFKDGTSSDYRDLCKGIFNECVLNELKIDEDFEKSGIDINSINPRNAFLELLQHLLIIARLNEDATKYFMPSLLKSFSFTDLSNKIPGESSFVTLTNDPEPLLIQFESADATNSFPRGFLCFLVVQLIHSTNWELYKKNLYHNLLTFYKVNGGYYVTLVDRIFFLETHVTHCNTNMSPIHHKIFGIINNALFAVIKKLNVKVNIKYGFLCKMCKDAKEVHMTYLSEDNNQDYSFCVCEEGTKLEMSHKVWLQSSSKVSM